MRTHNNKRRLVTRQDSKRVQQKWVIITRLKTLHSRRMILTRLYPPQHHKRHLLGTYGRQQSSS
jgi:hypothetical protein